MFPRAALTAFALVVLATIPTAAGEGPNPSAPVAAVAVISGQNVIVSWVPGAVEPDSFHVYGLESDTKNLLATVPGNNTQAIVPASFQNYAVAAVTGDIESPVMISVQVPTPCVGVYPGIPPDVIVGCTGGMLSKLTAQRLRVFVT